MRFLSIFIFLLGFFNASCYQRARSSIEDLAQNEGFLKTTTFNSSGKEPHQGEFETTVDVFVIQEDRCPDEHLQVECESLCRLEFNRCRLLCETEYCQSICDREYENCRNGCPCGADCKDGCINCENPLCPVGILVMGDNLNEAFSISFDGQTKTKSSISAPRNNYLELAPYALIKNELYIFGGYSNTQKIAKLIDCEWVEQAPKLINAIKQNSAALTIDNGQKALICFPYDMSPQRCEIFDSLSSVSTNSTAFPHSGGKLAFYKGQPTTVGNAKKTDMNKTETLSASGWSSLSDFPGAIGDHFLMGLPSGSLLLAGGGIWEGNNWFPQTAIWLLQDDIWTQIGDLQNADARGSAIMHGNSIFLVSGDNNPNAIVRLDFEGDELINQEIIGNTVSSRLPVLLLVPDNYCVFN